MESLRDIPNLKSRPSWIKLIWKSTTYMLVRNEKGQSVSRGEGNNAVTYLANGVDLSSYMLKLGTQLTTRGFVLNENSL